MKVLLLSHVGGAYEVMVVNLSPTGICIAGHERLTVESEVGIRFTTPEDRAVVYTATVRGVCQWSGTSGRRQEPWASGIAFRPMKLPEHLALVRFFLEHYGLRFVNPNDKRRQARLAFNQPLPMELRTAEGHRIPVFLKDVSVDGLGFLTREPLDPAAPLHVAFKTAHNDVLELQARIVRSRRRPDGQHEVGASLDLLGEKDRATITEILARLGRPTGEDRGEAEQGTSGPAPWVPGLPTIDAERQEFLELYSTQARTKGFETPTHLQDYRPPWQRDDGPGS